MSERFDAVATSVPLLLLPLRLETRSGRLADGSWELKVRAYPDEVHLRRIAAGVSASEDEAARAYWTARWSAQDAAGPGRADPWSVLVGAVGPDRAPWVAEALRPTNPADRGGAPPAFPVPPAGEAGRAVLLPDVLRVVVTQSGTTVSAVGAVLPVAGVPTGSASTDLEALAGALAGLTEQTLDPTDPLAWLSDFGAAEAVGLGLRVALPHGDARVERVAVVGVRTAEDPETCARALEGLLEAHRHSSGVALPPVGTPTNNTPGRRAAWSRLADRPGAPELDRPPAPGSGTAGSDLASALGLEPRAFAGWDGADVPSSVRAGAAAAALWPVTWGGLLDRLPAPAVPGRLREGLRQHAGTVRGRGPLPPVRIGRQPYGVLPITALRPGPSDDAALRAVLAVLQRLGPLWARAAQDRVPRVMSGALGTVLPEVLGQGPVSRSLRVRRAVGLGSAMGVLAERVDPVELAARTRLVRLAERVLSLPPGALGDPLALGVQRLLGLPYADDSDGDALRALGAGADAGDSASVLQVLVRLAHGQTRASLDRLVERERWLELASGLEEHAEELGSDRAQVAADALRAVGQGELDRGRVEAALELLDLEGAPWARSVFLRRFPVQRLRPDAVRAAAGAVQIAEAALAVLRAALVHLDVTDAAAVLAEVPGTSERARLVAEVLDCASHRYDAWATSVATARLRRLRPDRPAGTDRPAGLAVGAYGAVEDLRIVGATPVADPPPQAPPGVLVPPRDAAAIVAPSTAHAATAAVLRGARLTHAPDDGPDDPLEVDLTSTRVRAATAVLDGVRAGQPLGALVGYRFERDLHDATADHRLDALVPSLRTLAPLVAAKDVDRVAVGAVAAALEAVAATDVVDGVRLRELYAAERLDDGSLPAGSTIVQRLAQEPPGHARYRSGPWTGPDADDLRLVEQVLRGLDRLLDAVADLLLAEGVHQLVAGDPARAAAALDALAGDGVPAQPDVTTAPITGVGLRHRLLVLAAARTTSPSAGWRTSPRSRVDPSLEGWARDALGPASDVVLAVGEGGAPTVRLSAGGLSALDLVAATGGPVELLWARLRRALPALPEQPPSGRPAEGRAFTDVWVLAGSLRALLTAARPCLPPDLEPTAAKDTPLRTVDVAGVRQRAGAARDELAAVAVPSASRARRLACVSRLASFGIDGGVDPAALPQDELGLHVAALLAERDRRVAAASAGLAAFDRDPPDSAAAAVGALTAVVAAVFADRLPVLPVLSAVAGTPFVRAWTGPASRTPDGGAVRQWLTTVSRVRPAAARLVESLLLREALGVRVRLRVVQSRVAQPPGAPPRAEPRRWVGLPFDPATPPDGVTACVVDAPATLRPAGRCVGVVVDGWSETVPRLRAGAELVTAGVAVHASGPDARAPQTLLLAVSHDGASWTWERLVELVDAALALARARLVTLERAPLGGAVLPAALLQDWSLQGEPVPRPSQLARFADPRAVMTHVRDTEG